MSTTLRLGEHFEHAYDTHGITEPLVGKVKAKHRQKPTELAACKPLEKSPALAQLLKRPHSCKSARSITGTDAYFDTMKRAALICSLSLAAPLQSAPAGALALLCVRVAALQRAGIIAAPSAKELERVAPQLIRAGDCVLSAGVALESQADMLKRLADRVVAVDVPRKASRSRGELFRSDDVRPLKRAGDVVSVLRADECFDCVVIDAAALLGFDLPIDTLVLCEGLRRRQETPPTILVRSSALATLAGRLAAGDDLKRIARILRMHDERPSLDNTRIYEAQPVIVGARGVREYRNCIDTVVRPGDRVLELGCHFGTTTAMLANAASYALGIDVGTSIIAKAKEEHPLVDFMVGDAWGVSGLAALGPWDVVFVDVGGLSGADGTLDALALARSLGAALEPRAVVMKSKCLRRLAKSLAPSTRLGNVWDHERIEYV